MRANAAVPDSLNYHFDAMSTDHDSIGLFQQRNQGWGTVQQRMNVYASAGMFLDALAKIDGWENMEPAHAIALVQRNRDGAVTYAPLVAAATNEVATIRAGQGKFTPQVNFAGVGASNVQQTVAGQDIVGVAVGNGGVPGISQNSPSPGSIPANIPGRPPLAWLAGLISEGARGHLPLILLGLSTIAIVQLAAA